MKLQTIGHALDAMSDKTMLARYAHSGAFWLVLEYLDDHESLAHVPLWFLRQFLTFVYLSESALQPDLPQSLTQQDTRT